MMMVKRIRTLIVEDEDAAVNRLKKEFRQLRDVAMDILHVSDSVADVVSWLEEGNSVDLIFMDIQLTDGLSFEIFRQIDVPCPVIFTTAFDEYAIQAFKVNSIDYLLKPIDPQELQGAIDRYQKLPSNNGQEQLNQLVQLASEFRPTAHRSSFLVSYRQKMLMIDVNEVAYFFIKERGVFLRRKDGTEYVLDFFLDDLEQQLEPAKFFRANRQYLVARSAIREIEPYFNGRLVLTVEPQAKEPVIISKERTPQFKKWANY